LIRVKGKYFRPKQDPKSTIKLDFEYDCWHFYFKDREDCGYQWNSASAVWFEFKVFDGRIKWRELDKKKYSHFMADEVDKVYCEYINDKIDDIIFE